MTDLRAERDELKARADKLLLKDQYADYLVVLDKRIARL